jgi:hypothetical protein
MEPRQRLEVFLPRLRAELVKNGLSEEAAKQHCDAMKAGKMPGFIATLAEYQEAWTVAQSIMALMTNDEDGSGIAAWLKELSTRTSDFEDEYRAMRGHYPMHPGGPESDEQAGSA